MVEKSKKEMQQRLQDIQRRQKEDGPAIDENGPILPLPAELREKNCACYKCKRNTSAMDCPFGRCGVCCPGIQCARHAYKRYVPFTERHPLAFIGRLPNYLDCQSEKSTWSLDGMHPPPLPLRSLMKSMGQLYVRLTDVYDSKVHSIPARISPHRIVAVFHQ